MLSAALFAVGLVGVMLRRSPLVILLSIEIMLNAGNLLLIAASRYVGGNDGQVFALVVMGVAAAEVVVGLGLIVALSRARVEPRRRRAAEPARMTAAYAAWLALAAPLAGRRRSASRSARPSRGKHRRLGRIARDPRRLRRLVRRRLFALLSRSAGATASSSRPAGTGSRPAASRRTSRSWSTRSRS